MHTKDTEMIFFKKKNSVLWKLTKETILKRVFHANDWKYAKKLIRTTPPVVPILESGHLIAAFENRKLLKIPQQN